MKVINSLKVFQIKLLKHWYLDDCVFTADKKFSKIINVC